MAKTQPVMIDPLVADIMTAMMADTHNTTNRVIESLEAQILDLKAWKAIVTDRILSLVDKPYAASPRMFEEALHVAPSELEDEAAHQRIYDFPGSTH